MRIVVSLLGSLAVVYAGLCALLYFTQRSQIYFPTPRANAPGTSELLLERADATLRILLVDRASDEAVVYFGGNADQVAAHATDFAAAFPHHTIYLVNYRGYGGSTGSPTEAALLGDAEALHDQIARRHARISLIGRSLGSGVAVHLASVRAVHRLVLVTPFDSLVNVARDHFRLFPVGLLMRDRYDSVSRAANIRAPTLLVIAGSDEIIYAQRSEALAAALPRELVRIVRIADADHNSLDAYPEFLESVAAFLNEGDEADANEARSRPSEEKS